MVSRFHDRLRHAGTRFAEQSEFVTIRRGNLTTVNVPAFRILKRGEEILPGVSVTRLEFQDFTIQVSDYQFGGNATWPQPGDEIHLQASKGERFRVSSRGSNEPPYRFVTADRERIRIMTDRLAAGVG